MTNRKRPLKNKTHKMSKLKKTVKQRNIRLLRQQIFLYIHVTVHRNRFFLNNQPDALIIQIYSVIKL